MQAAAWASAQDGLCLRPAGLPAAVRLTRLWGPQVVEGLEETRTQLVVVTEAVFCSLGNLLTGFQGLPDKVCRPCHGTPSAPSLCQTSQPQLRSCSCSQQPCNE